MNKNEQIKKLFSTQERKFFNQYDWQNKLN